MNTSPLTRPAQPAPGLFDADFMRKFETLAPAGRKLFRGQSRNDRPKGRHGRKDPKNKAGIEAWARVGL